MSPGRPPIATMSTDQMLIATCRPMRLSTQSAMSPSTELTTIGQSFLSAVKSTTAASTAITSTINSAIISPPHLNGFVLPQNSSKYALNAPAISRLTISMDIGSFDAMVISTVSLYIVKYAGLSMSIGM